jgi:hypothetical protein
MIDQPGRRDPSVELHPRAQAALRRILLLTKGVVRRIREQADEEERERLVAGLAALDGINRRPALGLMSMRPERGVPKGAGEDPLERLWKLPAVARDRRSPGSRRR